VVVGLTMPWLFPEEERPPASILRGRPYSSKPFFCESLPMCALPCSTFCAAARRATNTNDNDPPEGRMSSV
jgi:hypothetical protein